MEFCVPQIFQPGFLFKDSDSLRHHFHLIDLSFHYYLVSCQWLKLYQLLWTLAQTSSYWEVHFSSKPVSEDDISSLVQRPQYLQALKRFLEVDAHKESLEITPDQAIAFHLATVLFFHGCWDYFCIMVSNGNQKRALVPSMAETIKIEDSKKKRKVEPSDLAPGYTSMVQTQGESL